MHLQLSNHLAQKHSVVVNAQLQQAISLLQLSNTELQSYIENEAAENPLLKCDRPSSGPATLSERAKSRAAADFDELGARVAEEGPSLYAHVARQLDAMFADPSERLVADMFLETLEPSGWLGEPLEELAFRTGLDLEAAEEFLYRLQDVEPTGLFARSLSECLRLQAREAGLLTPAFGRLLDNLPRLAAADLSGLCRLCGVEMPELRKMLCALRGLDPKPGAAFSADTFGTRAPDLIVTETESGWSVQLNSSTAPSVDVDEAQGKAWSRDDLARDFVADRLSSARWLRRAVEHRNQTTLLIGSEIVRRQAGFLRRGAQAIVPMTLRDVAEAVGVHESTVSRVTTGMLIQTPLATVPLKSFFSSALEGHGEGATSSAAIRHRIAELVKAEDPLDPLSDDALAAKISDEGTRLARRTVAKYREMLNIPSSFQRRRLALLKAS